LTSAHAERSDKKDWATTESVNAVQSRKRCENVDQVDDDLENKRIGELLDVLGEIRRAVVNLVRSH
jgi:aminoglycoside phosphotransferase